MIETKQQQQQSTILMTMGSKNSTTIVKLKHAAAGRFWYQPCMKLIRESISCILCSIIKWNHCVTKMRYSIKNVNYNVEHSD